MLHVPQLRSLHQWGAGSVSVLQAHASLPTQQGASSFLATAKIVEQAGRASSSTRPADSLPIFLASTASLAVGAVWGLSSLRRRSERGARAASSKVLIARNAGYRENRDEFYWEDRDEEQRGRPRDMERPPRRPRRSPTSWKQANAEMRQQAEYQKRLEIRKSGKRGSRYNTRVVDQREEMDVRASDLRSRQKRPRFSWREAAKDDPRTGKISGSTPSIGTEEVWLSKFLSHSARCSRRGATELVLQGRVEVNGEVVQKIAMKVDPTQDEVVVDGEIQTLQTLKELTWVMVHKPKGYDCHSDDPNWAKQVIDLVPYARKRKLRPVGRVDRWSQGLVILTNDYEWMNILTHARYGNTKRYKVTVTNGRPSSQALKALREGLELPDQARPLLPIEDLEVVRNSDGSIGKKTDLCTMTFTLRDNSYRVVKRMFEYIGHPLKSQKRIGFGPLKLDVPNSRWRPLTPKEVRQLKGPTILQKPSMHPEDEYAQDLEGVDDYADDESGGAYFDDQMGSRRESWSQERRGNYDREDFDDAGEFMSESWPEEEEETAGGYGSEYFDDEEMEFEGEHVLEEVRNINRPPPAGAQGQQARRGAQISEPA
mmetsp:Transcript_58938/g.140695  ORF Transcript_58938/g.140695 Transcript_58938/m.140695 type:complete len:598 (+) Transcript_58938:103-1896(+)